MKRIITSLTSLAIVLIIACGGNNESPDAEIDKAMDDVEEAMDDVEDAMENIENAMDEMDDDDANEREIALEELPDAVSTAIASAYPDYTIDEAGEVTNENGSLSYEVELKKGEEELEALFSASGEFLGIEEDKEEDDDEEHEGH